MYIDSLLKVSSAQAFGAAAVSTNAIDLGLPSGVGTPTKRQIGTGEPVGFAFQVTTQGTVADSLVEIISTTDNALTAGIIVHASITIKLAAALVGALFYVPLPPGTPTQQFLGIRVTTAGGTISGSAWLIARDLFSLTPPAAYAKNFNA